MFLLNSFPKVEELERNWLKQIEDISRKQIRKQKRLKQKKQKGLKQKKEKIDFINAIILRVGNDSY